MRQIVIAGAGYAGLHIAQKLGSWIAPRHDAHIVLVDQNAFHQLRTELPRVVSGARSDERVRIDVDTVLPSVVEFKQADIKSFDFSKRSLLVNDGSLPYWRLVLALGRRRHRHRACGSDRGDATKTGQAEPRAG